MCLFSQVKSNGLLVFVPKFGIEGPVYLSGGGGGGGGGAAGAAAGGGGSGGAKKAAAAAGGVEGEAVFVLDEEKQTVRSRCGCGVEVGVSFAEQQARVQHKAAFRVWRLSPRLADSASRRGVQGCARGSECSCAGALCACPPVLRLSACRDGSVAYRVFDACAVRLSVEEGVGHRRSLKLELVPRGLLADADRVA